MNDEVFIIELDENQAVYSDDLREFKEDEHIMKEKSVVRYILNLIKTLLKLN